MPPKVKITKEDIIKTSVDLIRNSGEQFLNARAIASALNCSTQPIFSNFTCMEELYECVIENAYERYFNFLQAEASGDKYPKYKAFGMAYIEFAKQERELFKLLFMRDRTGQNFKPTTDWELSVKMIMQANQTTKEIAEKIHMQSWICVHGIATMIATNFMQFNLEDISNTLTDLYQGLKLRHLRGES